MQRTGNINISNETFGLLLIAIGVVMAALSAYSIFGIANICINEFEVIVKKSVFGLTNSKSMERKKIEKVFLKPHFQAKHNVQPSYYSITFRANGESISCGALVPLAQQKAVVGFLRKQLQLATEEPEDKAVIAVRKKDMKALPREERNRQMVVPNNLQIEKSPPANLRIARQGEKTIINIPTTSMRSLFVLIMITGILFVHYMRNSEIMLLNIFTVIIAFVLITELFGKKYLTILPSTIICTSQFIIKFNTTLQIKDIVRVDISSNGVEDDSQQECEIHIEGYRNDKYLKFGKYFSGEEKKWLVVYLRKQLAERGASFPKDEQHA